LRQIRESIEDNGRGCPALARNPYGKEKEGAATEQLEKGPKGIFSVDWLQMEPSGRTGPGQILLAYLLWMAYTSSKKIGLNK